MYHVGESQNEIIFFKWTYLYLIEIHVILKHIVEYVE